MASYNEKVGERAPLGRKRLVVVFWVEKFTIILFLKLYNEIIQK